MGWLTVIAKSINVIPEAPIAAMVEIATRAEALGFDRCWVYDEGLATRDLYVTLSAIANLERSSPSATRLRRRSPLSRGPKGRAGGASAVATPPVGSAGTPP